MTNVNKDLEFARSIIEGKEHQEYQNKYYENFYKMWPFTTINMKKYLEPFDLKNKVCMTIQGSSDHIFEIFLKNPNKIIGIDTNPLTQYPFYLKQASFKVLENSEDFLNFFKFFDYPRTGLYNKNAFDKDIYMEIEKYLTGTGKIFWHELFQDYDPLLIRDRLFNHVDEIPSYVLYKSLKYLKKENYEYLRNNVDNINFEFLNEDVRNLNDVLNEKIDFFTLSNLIIYSKKMFDGNYLEQYKNMIEKLSDKLNIDGIIVAGYIYNIEDPYLTCFYGDISDKSIRNRVFNNPNFSYNYFKAMYNLHRGKKDKNLHDACLIYRKQN